MMVLSDQSMVQNPSICSILAAAAIELLAYMDLCPSRLLGSPQRGHEEGRQSGRTSKYRASASPLRRCGSRGEFRRKADVFFLC
jgi:hypothetical protein